MTEHCQPCDRGRDTLRCPLPTRCPIYPTWRSRALYLCGLALVTVAMILEAALIAPWLWWQDRRTRRA